MTFALGFRVRSGHAVAIALSGSRAAPEFLARADVQLADAAVPETKQPYHAGFGTARDSADEIERLVALVRRQARASVDQLFTDGRFGPRSCRGAALVVGSIIDPEKVANPHIRAHAREGRLFRGVVEDALRANGVRCAILVEKTLGAEAAKELRRPDAEIKRVVGELGRAAKGPWRAYEKAAATAAWMTLP